MTAQVKPPVTGGGGGTSDHGALTGLSDDDHPQYTTTAEATTIAGTAVTTHEGLPNPHPGYLTPAEGDAAYDVMGSAAAAQAASQPLDSDLTAIAALATTAYGRAFLALADAAAARTALALGTAATSASGDFQPADSDLTAIAALSTTAFGRGLLALADAAALRTAAGLGTAATSATGDFQAADAELSAIAGLVSAADRLAYFTGSGTASLATLTAFARTLLDDADGPTALATLGAVALAGSTSTGEQVAPSFKASGKSGATATPVTLAGGTASGAPSSGAHVKGELVMDDTGKAWYCTVAGTPGTWVQVGGGSGGDVSPLRPMTGDPSMISGAYGSVAVANRCHWRRVLYGTTKTISKVGYFANTSSGNLKVGVYADSGSGTPGARKAISASTAVGSTNTYNEVSLGSSVSCGPGDWLCLVADNTTATFAIIPASGIVQWGTGHTDINRYADGAFSPADPAGATSVDVNRQFFLIGVV